MKESAIINHVTMDTFLDCSRDLQLLENYCPFGSLGIALEASSKEAAGDVPHHATFASSL